MRKILNLVGLITVVLFIAACSSSSPAEPEAVEEAEVATEVVEEAVENEEETPEEEAKTTADGISIEEPAAGSQAINFEIDTVDQVSGFPAYSLPTDELEILEDRGDTVLVRHRFGETVVPKKPERVFTDAATLPIALTLDLPIVATYLWDGIQEIPSWEEQTANTIIGDWDSYAYNFEFILNQDPDLILAFSHLIYGSDDQEEVYNQLSEIAPTIVLFNDPAELWPQATAELAKVFELSEEEKTRLENANQTIAEACEPLQETIGDETVMLIQPLSGEMWGISPGWYDGDNYLPYSTTSHYYYFCGLTPPENMIELTGTDSQSISIELIPEITADHLFVDTWDVDVAAEARELLENPLWQAVPAVQKGQVYFIDSVFGVSYDMTLVAIEEVTNAVMNPEAE